MTNTELRCHNISSFDVAPRCGRIACVAAILVGAFLSLFQSPVHANGNRIMDHTPTRFFLSGHSLTDDPYAGYLDVIAESQGAPLDWNQQIVIGSHLSWRTRGDTSKPGNWSGYGYGKNRDGKQGLNVLQEFAREKEKPYDTLLLIEGHNAPTTLIWNDTVRHFRHFHERFIAQNSAGQTYFIEPWEGIVDKGNLAPWVENEMSVSKAWGCVSTRINVSLAHEGRTDRIGNIPTGAALAALVDAISTGKIPPLVARDKAAAVNLLLSDDVHLGSRGQYYLAVLTYMTMTGKPLTKAWYPTNRMDEKEARMLQDFAWEFLERWKNEAQMDVPACRRFFIETFCESWYGYTRGNQGGNEVANCQRYFSRETLELAGHFTPNPFVFDPAGDAGYWFPEK